MFERTVNMYENDSIPSIINWETFTSIIDENLWKNMKIK